MDSRRFIFRIHVIVAALALLSCSGDTGFASSAGGSGISKGTITGFGSVFVNGVEYDTSNVEVLIDGATVGVGQSAEAALDLGMVVTVEGIINDDGQSGTARTIEYRKRVVGAIEGPVNLVNDTFIVLRQTIAVTPSTLFVGTTGAGTALTGLRDLFQGNVVEVSGFSAASGEVRATRIALLPSLPNDLSRLRGTITSPPLNSQFHIGSLSVAYQNIGPDFFPETGDFVEVEGRYDGIGRLTATDLRLASDGVIGEEGDKVEIEGIITAVSGGTVTINGQKIFTTAATVLEDISLNSTAINRRAEIEGTVSADQIVANVIRGELEGTFELIASLQEEDGTASTITVLQRIVHITPDTVIANKGDFFATISSEVESVTPTFLSMHLVPVPSGEFVATRVEFAEQGTYLLNGPIESGSDLSTGLFTIEGIPVTFTSPLPEGVTIGTPVQVIGTINPEGNGITAQVIQSVR